MEVVRQMAAWLGNPASWNGPGGIPTRVGEHVAISLASLLVASAIALPVGLWIGHTGRGASIAVNLANLGRAIPSLAAIGIVVPFTQALDPDLGFSLYPTLVGMIVLAVPPILVNSYVGVWEVDRDLVEAARGMGFRERQILGRVEIPVAMPVILGGLRSAAVQVIATATLGAIYSLGGLGRFIVDGIAQNDDGQLFGGVLLVAILALSAEGSFALVQRVVTSPGLRSSARDRTSRTIPAQAADA
jgi:osmoprotectant transport system permease protein